MASALPGVYRLSFADWTQFPDDGRLYELFDGELQMTPPPNIAHQRISRELEFEILRHLREHDAGEIFDAPTGVRLSDADVVEPDLLVVLKPNAARIGKQVIEGAPDLVVEILSPGTAQRDLVTKRDLYARSRVQEYWIVDPEARSVELLTLEGTAYTRVQLFRASDRLHSPLLPGLDIELSKVFIG